MWLRTSEVGKGPSAAPRYRAMPGDEVYVQGVSDCHHDISDPEKKTRFVTFCAFFDY